MLITSPRGSYGAVVRVYATTQEPDCDNPWQASTPSSSTGSGVVIGPDRILTGAHVVAHATFLQVQKISDPDKVVARIEAVCHDCDLALLRVDDPHFTKGIAPAELGELPELRDKVQVAGYPLGGEEISITEGVVSRVEIQRYSHSRRHLLAVTVDAAINPGNSGGPVFKDDRVVGIAFQKLSGADNIGELVPASLLRRFLDGVKAGRDPAVPGLGIVTQDLDNPMLRTHAGLKSGETGVLVIAVEEGNSAWSVLQPGDALLAIDGVPIAHNGTIVYRQQYRTRFSAALGDYHVGDTVSARVLRGGVRLDLDVKLEPLRRLVPRSTYEVGSTFFVWGGLVFQRLTRDYLATWNEWWHRAPQELLHHYYSGVRSETRREVVVLTQVLADDVNVGYASFHNETVASVNGRVPVDMADFVASVEAASGLVDIRMASHGRMVLDVAQVAEANARILARYHVTRDRSPELEPAA